MTDEVGKELGKSERSKEQGNQACDHEVMLAGWDEGLTVPPATIRYC